MNNVMSNFISSVSFRYLRPRRQHGFISLVAGFSLLGIMLGVATLIIVMSVMNGFKHELVSRIIGLNGHVQIESLYGDGIAESPDFLKHIKGNDAVKSTYGLIEGQVLASYNTKSLGVMVRGISSDDIKNMPILYDNILIGDVASFKNNGVLIGMHLARKLGLSVGDNVVLTSPNGRVTAFGSMPRVKSYYVAGLFDVGMYEYDSSFIFMPLGAAQKFFSLPKQIGVLEVVLSNINQVEPFRYDLQKTLPPEYLVKDWQQRHAQFFNAIEVERNVMFLILTLIIIVAAFNIISSQVMLVKDKSRDIAILRTMGASRRQIMRIFMVTGGSIGVIGTVMGVFLGYGFAANIQSIREFLESLSGTNLFAAEIYFLSKLPARVELSEVLWISSLALILTFLASFYPAWKASKIDPAEVLRYE